MLLNQASVNLYEKQKIGLVGQNGCGKSSLFRLILGDLAQDSGECVLNTHLRISHLSQSLPESGASALDFVLAGDEVYHSLQTRLLQAKQCDNHDEVVFCHEQLSQLGGYSKPAQAASILAGLGFKPEEIHQPVCSFSGGWRMRLGLARCLMKPADLLLLDEPTNHLDVEAIFWLEKWLKQCPSSVILISHDREFLDAIVTHILHIEAQQLKIYSGNYTRFEVLRAQQWQLQQKMYEKQQAKIDHLMLFVNRFRAKATKAKQAQSRLNAIAKMDVMAKAQYDSPFSFQFDKPEHVSNPLIRCESVHLGYGESLVLKDIQFVLTPGARIALLGPNGQGKSTFIKALTGELAPLSGRITKGAHLNIGYYAQHQLEQLDLDLSPIQTIQSLRSDATEQSIRDYLGGFNFFGDMAEGTIQHFSGGEKARLALAKIVWQKPNLLLLDEPTNHLDLNMRSAIEMALQTYEGALILISHDRHLLRSAVDDFYLVFQQKFQPFTGDLDDYHQWLLQREKTQSSSCEAKSNTDHRERRALQNQLKRIEQKITDYQIQKNSVELQLADDKLYDATQQSRLELLIQNRTSIHEKLEALEKEWFLIVERLDS